MRIVIAAAALAFPLMCQAEYAPFDTQHPMNFECQTGVKVHVVDNKHVVINGDLDAEVISISEGRLQADIKHGNSLYTHIDMSFMGYGYYSLMIVEFDTSDAKGPWEYKILSTNPLICSRTQ